MQIELANSEGKPRLVLRGNADTGGANGTQISHNQLLGRPDEPVKVEAPPAPPPTDVFSNTEPAAKGRPVQIIRGGKEDTIRFDEEGNQQEPGSGGGNGATPTAGKGAKPAGSEQRTLSGTAPAKAPGKDAGRGNW